MFKRPRLSAPVWEEGISLPPQAPPRVTGVGKEPKNTKCAAWVHAWVCACVRGYQHNWKPVPFLKFSSLILFLLKCSLPWEG